MNDCGTQKIDDRDVGFNGVKTESGFLRITSRGIVFGEKLECTQGIVFSPLTQQNPNNHFHAPDFLFLFPSYPNLNYSLSSFIFVKEFQIASQKMTSFSRSRL